MKNKKYINKVLSLLLGLMFAVIMSAPYIIFKEQIQQLSVIGYIGVLIACAISNVSILLPSSSTLIVVTASTVLNPVLCIILGGIGTALGEQSSYICGRIGRKGFEENSEKEMKVVSWVKKHDFMTVFVFAFLPLPVFDLVGIAAGALKMNWPKYIIAAVLGKVSKFILAVLAVYYLLPQLLPYVQGPGHMILEQFLNQFGIQY